MAELEECASYMSMLTVPWLIPDLEQIVIDYIIDIEFIIDYNNIITKKYLRHFKYNIDAINSVDWKRYLLIAIYLMHSLESLPIR